MTTTTKDITNFLDDQGINYNPIRMLNLLGKLDHEDLDLLYDMLEECHESGEHEGDYKMEQRCQEQYDRGYADGYDDGFSTEE